MPVVIDLDCVSKYYSNEPTLDQVTFDIRSTEHVALMGPNGAGKTTLLKIMMRELDVDEGSIRLAKNATIGVLHQRHDLPNKQTVLESARQAMEPVRALIDQANQIANAMADSIDDRNRALLEKRFDCLQSEIIQRDGYRIDNKLHRVLSGLGFPESTYDHDVNHLSGGQLNRLMLARLLLEEPTLMLLDEPSNHLDIASTEWLEDFLKQSKQAFLLVSHDRYFLDRVSDHTLELVNARIEKYPGNYSKYKILKNHRLDVARATYAKQQTEIEKLESYIRRNHHGLKHAQANDRRKKLERLNRVDVPREIHAPPMAFANIKRAGDIVVRCSKISNTFGDLEVFSDVELQIQWGQRWGLIGPNACGKSTLLKCLSNQLAVDSGTITFGERVAIGYFDQNLSGIADDKTANEAIRPSQKAMIDQERRELLATFGVIGDTSLQTVKSLSGGERNRVALAFLAAQDANFLILDEPTNHLDLWARHSLETALKNFDGTLLMASHDRYFIDELCDHLIVFEEKRVFVFAGNYQEYRHQQNQFRKAEAAALAPFEKEQRQRARKEFQPAKRQRRFPYRKVADIEYDIRSHEARSEELHFELANPAVVCDENQVRIIKAELADINDALNKLHMHWDEAIELN